MAEETTRIQGLTPENITAADRDLLENIIKENQLDTAEFKQATTLLEALNQKANEQTAQTTEQTSGFPDLPDNENNTPEEEETIVNDVTEEEQTVIDTDTQEEPTVIIGSAENTTSEFNNNEEPTVIIGGSAESTANAYAYFARAQQVKSDPRFYDEVLEYEEVLEKEEEQTVIDTDTQEEPTVIIGSAENTTSEFNNNEEPTIIISGSIGGSAESKASEFDDIEEPTDNYEFNDGGIFNPTPYELKQIIEGLNASYTLRDYMQTIQPLGAKNIEDTMALNTPSDRLKAFTSPDFLLEAQQYYTNKKDKDAADNLNEINDLVFERLRVLDHLDITPNNAYAYFALAQQVKSDPRFYDEVLEKIAKALYNYDIEHFGSRSAEELNQNYNKVSFNLNLTINKEDALALLDEYTFEGKAKEQKETKKDFLELAAQMAALDLAKQDNPSQDEINKVLKDKLDMLLYDPSGKKTFTETEVAAKLATGVVMSQEIQTRTEQKFGLTNNFSTSIANCLAPLDKRLSKRYGKKYETAKKYALLCSKVGIGVLKSTAMFTVAGMVPPPGIGTAALICYNTAKQWKGMKQQLSDPSISKNKKAAILLGAGVTTVLSALSVGTGLNSAIESLGLNTPATVQTVVNTATALGIYGRLALSSIANTVPNWVEKYTLKYKEKRLAKALIKENDPAKRQKIVKEQQLLQARKEKNKEELIAKTIGATLGTAFAASGLPQKIFGASPAENTAQTELSQQETDTQTNSDIEQTQETTSPERSNPDQTHGYTAPEDENTSQTESENNTQNSNENENDAATQADRNLEAAKAENSGHIHRSAYSSAMADLESNQDKINLSDEEIRTTSENMSKIYGTNAYMATHAALAEPYAVAAAMGIDNIHSSAELLDYMQTHDCSNNEGLQTYMSEHFDDQQRFHYSGTQNINTNTPTPPQNTVQNEPQAVEPTPQNTGHSFRFEPVDKIPGTEHQPASPQPAPHAHPQTARVTTVEQHSPAEQVVLDAAVGSPEWLRANGWVYDAQLSNGLNRLGATDGSHNGYQGAYYKADNPDRIMFLPNDPSHDKPEFAGRGNAKASQFNNSSQYAHCNHAPHGYGCPDEKRNYGYGAYSTAQRVLYGTGIITPHSGVDRVIQTVNNSAYTAHNILDVIHHGKHIFR